MKKPIIFLVLTIIVLLTCLLLPEVLQAQAPAIPGSGSGGSGPPTQNPIDGGLALLAVAGGAYAYKKLRKKD